MKKKSAIGKTDICTIGQSLLLSTLYSFHHYFSFYIGDVPGFLQHDNHLLSHSPEQIYVSLQIL